MRLLVDKTNSNPKLMDLSELVRPDAGGVADVTFNAKSQDAFRDYEDETNHLIDRVKRTYHQMHTNQTVKFVAEKHKKWLNFDHLECSVLDALDMLNELVDESDPDLNLPNIVHAFQTAERIREEHPDKDWFHITGLIHDLGKILAFYDEPQWAVVGDTFPVGCKHQKSIVYSSWSFEENSDGKNPKYNSIYGMYKPQCGLDKVLMSWGHDEYLYRVLKNHGAMLPEEALYMIRYHSFYPWHTGGDYDHLTNEKDREMLPWVKEFNKYDLYTKSVSLPDIEALKPYYQSLVDKYIPGLVKF